MITLITGLPGNGKTLFALWYIKAKAVAETREVYYHNIKDLALPWTIFDPETWMDLPHGSIIVIDECQDVFPKKPNGSKLPEFYSELAKHRHRGFDIFLITQHPSLVDNFVRQLVGQHFHSVRKFGLARSTIYEWSAANPAPQNPSSQKSSVSMKFPYPKDVYTWYKSAEVHTVKRAIPAKLILAVFFIIAVLLAGWFALDHYQNRGKAPSVPVPGAPGVVSAAGRAVGGFAGSVGSASQASFDPVADARQFVYASTPRVAGLPQTAPKYDELTRPTRVPVPAACIQRGRLDGPKGVVCKCYSQQGTVMPVPIDMCMAIARDGYFEEFDGDRDARAKSERPGQASQVAQVGQLGQADAGSGGPLVVMMPDMPPAARENRPISK